MPHPRIFDFAIVLRIIYISFAWRGIGVFLSKRDLPLFGTGGFDFFYQNGITGAGRISSLSNEDEGG